MAKVKEQTPLEIVEWELTELEERLARADHNITQAEQMVQEVEEKRINPNAKLSADDDARARSMEQALPGWRDTRDHLLAKRNERRERQVELRHEESKLEAGDANADWHDGFRKFFGSIDVEKLERFANQGHLNQTLYSRANGFREMNTENMLRVLGEFTELVKFLKTL